MWLGSGRAAGAGVPERVEEAEDTRTGEGSGGKDKLEDDVGRALCE